MCVCVSFPCEHTFCEDCTKRVAADFELVRCPQCRNEARQDELEVVEYTATKQWDELLAVATAWAKIDRRHELDTSGEEAEEEFVNDDTTAETRLVESYTWHHDFVLSSQVCGVRAGTCQSTGEFLGTGNRR